MVRESDVCRLVVLLYCLSSMLCYDIDDQGFKYFPRLCKTRWLSDDILKELGIPEIPEENTVGDAVYRFLRTSGKRSETAGCSVSYSLEKPVSCIVFIRIPLLRTLLLKHSKRIGLIGSKYINVLLENIINSLSFAGDINPKDYPSQCSSVASRRASVLKVVFTPDSLGKLFSYADICNSLIPVFEKVWSLKTDNFR